MKINTFELRKHNTKSRKNKTFALKACEAANAKDRRPLFTGFIEKGMDVELRRLASVFRQIVEQDYE